MIPLKIDSPKRRDPDDESLIDDMALSARRGSVFLFIKSYFDESYNDQLLCVAGYSFTSRNARLFDDAWRKMLARYKRLPFFRMSLCNSRKDPFDRLTEQECVNVATEAIGLIKRYASIGYSVTIDKKAFNKIITKKGVVSTPYEMCAWMCLIATRIEINKIMPVSSMSFIFEAGFQDEGPANKMMKSIFNSPKLREYYRYNGHYFLDKKESRPTQAADLLAWQWYKDRTRRTKGLIRPRGDLRALAGDNNPPHWAMHIDHDMLIGIVERINQMADSPLGSEIAGLAVRYPDHPMFAKETGEPGDPKEYQKLKQQYPERF